MSDSLCGGAAGSRMVTNGWEKVTLDPAAQRHFNCFAWRSHPWKNKKKVPQRLFARQPLPLKPFFFGTQNRSQVHSLTHSPSLVFWTFFLHLRPRPDINRSQLAAPVPPGEERLSLFTSQPAAGLWPNVRQTCKCVHPAMTVKSLWMFISRCCATCKTISTPNLAEALEAVRENRDDNLNHRANSPCPSQSATAEF